MWNILLCVCVPLEKNITKSLNLMKAYMFRVDIASLKTRNTNLCARGEDENKLLLQWKKKTLRCKSSVKSVKVFIR